MTDVLQAKDSQGAPGRVYLLVYDPDDLRAPLLEDAGARIAFGSLQQLVHAFTEVVPTTGPSATATSATSVLPAQLLPITAEVASEKAKPPNIRRMFNGGAASYADIAAGATFERTVRYAGKEFITENGGALVGITGAGGVGKTTFARQLLAELMADGFVAWEHSRDFAFRHEPWLTVEASLRSQQARGVLLVDECTHWMRETNLLIDRLSNLASPALQLVLTANSALWKPRLKSPNIYKRGKLLELSRLDEPELASLISLVDRHPEIATLVHKSFRAQSRRAQLEALRHKCSADMFVCLKNIFDSDSLDTILLREFADLDETSQEYYRYIADLEAIGARVHRQLVLRMLKIPPLQIQAILDRLSGIVDEYTVSEREGIYGWSTRHLVIARKITEYKFSSVPELVALFEQVIENLYPTVQLEIQTIREVCDSDFGIGRLADRQIRRDLYRKLVAIAPRERIPWHRLIRETLEVGTLEETEQVLRDAEEAVGADSPIDRYKVRLLVVRSQKTEGISAQDRRALLRKAYELALRNVTKHRHDKYSYDTLCRAALLLVEAGDSPYLLDEAIKTMRSAMDRILDPDFIRWISLYESKRARMN
jgi:hypothetical protein